VEEVVPDAPPELRRTSGTVVPDKETPRMSSNRIFMLAIPAFVAVAALVSPTEAG